MKPTINRILLFATVALMALLSSCNDAKHEYVIGVSQCSEDSWRGKLIDEMKMATYINENLQIINTSADNDDKEQGRQIDQLVADGVDLLIVAPNQVNMITDAIDRAFQKGIPVILFDRKSDSSKYTSFMGADNFAMGEMLAKFVVDKLPNGGNIVEIGGLEGSTPAAERHRGFNNIISQHPNIHIVGYEKGDWTEESGIKAMRTVLSKTNERIDCVFGGNDRMAVGARKVLQEKNLDRDDIMYVGVDALPDAGMTQVRDGILTCSAIYPTHGDELIQLALNILEGKPYDKEYELPSSIVTPDNANTFILQHKELLLQTNKLQQMHESIEGSIKLMQTQIIILFAICGVVMFFLVMLVFTKRKR